MPTLPASEEAKGVIGWLRTLLVAAETDRAKRATRWLVVGTAAWQGGTHLRNIWLGKRTYTVSVPYSDDIYTDVHRWVLDHLAPGDRKALTAQASRQRIVASGGHAVLAEATPDSKEPARRRPTLHLFYDGSVTQTVHVDGHKVEVTVDESEGHVVGERYYPPREKVLFRARGVEARDAVLALLQRMTEERFAEPLPRLYVATRWDSWRRSTVGVRRPLSSVVVRAGQSDAIVADLGDFLAAEERYVRLGLPWHRGYLFHGPPGTGKTSMAKALAEHFDLDAHYVPLSDLKSDTGLLELIGNIGERGLLLLEDIDVVHAASSRDDAETDEALSLSGLLNALDGLATPHGLVTVMTTNAIEGLDAALTRPGRVDRSEMFGYLDDEQLKRLVDHVTSESHWRPPPLRDALVSHAEVVEAAKQYLDDPAAARAAVKDLVDEAVRRA